MTERTYQADIDNCLDILGKGGSILYPTDTVWGLGCDATNQRAVDNIYRIKSRTDSKSMIILVDRFEELSKYVRVVPEITFDLLKSISNPVTVIYSNAIRLAENVIAQDGTIAIRVVKDDFCRELISAFGKPIVSTSANISGGETPAIFSHVPQIIRESVDYIVKHKQDYFTRSKPSTIIRLKEDGSYVVIRS